jgi:hypothetical protein
MTSSHVSVEHLGMLLPRRLSGDLSYGLQEHWRGPWSRKLGVSMLGQEKGA